MKNDVLLPNRFREVKKSRKKKKNEFSKPLRVAISFYDAVNFLGRVLHNQVRKIDYSVPKEEAVKNLDSYVQNVIKNCHYYIGVPKSPIKAEVSVHTPKKTVKTKSFSDLQSLLEYFTNEFGSSSDFF